jgi:predicted O-methyltransferase YrrM
MIIKNIENQYNINKKYKTELNAVKKYIDNEYIYDIFYKYGFTINNKFIPLHSNINVYESVFISLLVNIYINKYKKKQKLNILEIGFAYGTSTLILLNQLIKYKYSKSYDVIDPNQTIQWKSIGIKNVEHFLCFMNTKIDFTLHEEDSLLAVPKLKKKYDISFIDGSHDEKIVIYDLIHSDKKLLINGLIIIDDVLHSGVKNAILDFFQKYKNYRRISIANHDFYTEPILYDKKAMKRSFENPNSMFCFQKIF